MNAKQYEVAWGCHCLTPFLISIWNILTHSPFTAQSVVPVRVVMMASSSQEAIIERMKKDFEDDDFVLERVPDKLTAKQVKDFDRLAGE